ncbi:MAG: ATP-binding protein [Acidobacteriota bacterium]
MAVPIAGRAPLPLPPGVHPARPDFSRGLIARRLPPACGAAILLLGTAVVIGWQTGSDRLIRILPGYRPMVYVTALCFMLAGLSLLLRASRWPRLSAIPAALAVCATAVKVLEYASGARSGFEATLLPGLVRVQPAMSRMPPITAIAFLIAGSALCAASGRRLARRPFVMGLSGALILGFATVVLMGYATGTTGYLWSPLAGMALHAAIGLFLLGMAVLVIARADEPEGMSKRPLWFLLAGGIAATLSLWWALVAQDRSFIERTVQLEADSFASRIATEIRARSFELSRMSKRWEQRGDLPRSEWEADARWYYAHQDGLQALLWSDSTLHVRWVIPLPGNEGAVDLDLRADSRRREALDQALQSGGVRITRPLRVAGGEPGFLIYSPISSGPSSGSLLVSAFRFRGWCDSVFESERARGTPIALFDGTREIYRSGTPPPGALSYARDSSTAGSLLPVRVRVWPSSDLLESRSRLATVALLVGLLITGLLALSVRLGRMARDRAYEAEDLNRSLSAEVLERRKAEEAVAERIRLADFAAEVGAALTRHATLGTALTQCADAMVRLLGGSTASVWALNPRTRELELSGSAGFASDEPNSRSRLRLGEHRLGRIARDQKPMLVSLENEVALEDDKSWARSRGMVAFAGYPLLVGERTVGVVAMFSDSSMSPASIRALASIADALALAIDRAQTSAALTANEERTRAVIDNMGGGLITTDARAIIETVNPAAERMFGYEAAELIGKHLGVLAPLVAGDDARAFMRQAAVDSLGKITEWPARRRDGSVFPMELALATFETADGRHFSGSLRDISERKEIDRMKKEFLSTVSHELRTPLTSIRGSLGLLAGGVLGPLPEDAKEVVAVAERNVVRLVDLINDILDLERLDTGRLEMRFERVPVARILARSLDAVRAFADSQSIALESVSSAAILFADADRLVQVLVNLLSNAIKFSPARSTVSVRVTENASGTEIRVADRGRGVPEAYREAIFERFRQVESSDARQKGGSGLGLAISRAIIEQHGGAIGMESREDEGSIFWIRLPAAPSGIPSPEHGADLSALSASAGVLVIEDDPALSNVIQRQLSRLKIPVRLAATGSEGVGLFRERAPDLLVLDLALPDMDGYEVVRTLQRDPAALETPMLVYTERDLTVKDRKRLVLGPTKYLTKSRSSDAEFLETVVKMVRGALQAVTTA